jgi:hypothetical protein
MVDVGHEIAFTKSWLQIYFQYIIPLLPQMLYKRFSDIAFGAKDESFCHASLRSSTSGNKENSTVLCRQRYETKTEPAQFRSNRAIHASARPSGAAFRERSHWWIVRDGGSARRCYAAPDMVLA